MRLVSRFLKRSSTLKTPTNDAVFTGIQPTGTLHIGNYLGSIRNIVRLQKQYSKVMLCIVDHHAITTRFVQDHDQLSYRSKLAEETIAMAEVLLACGVDPSRTILFVQSHVPAHAELCWLLSCVGPQSWLNFMVQYKEKADRNSSLGLYSYPVLMAADILLYGARLVPVGDDQQQHLQLTQRIADRFNSLFGPVLVRPEYLPAQISRVMSLTDGTKKMSKSDRSEKSRINLTDSAELIRQKILKAKTDSINEIYLDEEKRPEVSNLLRLYAAFQNIDAKEAEAHFRHKTMPEFKKQLAPIVSNYLSKIQERLAQVQSDPNYVNRVLREGAEKARQLAAPRLTEVKKKLGYYIPQ